MTRCKGMNLIHMRDWVRRQYGQVAWDRVIAAMPADDRETLRTMVAVAWYDLALQHRLLRTIDRVAGKGDLSTLQPMARWTADDDLTRIHRLFLRLANPAYVLEKAGDYWRRFYDSGSWEVVRESPTSAA